VLTTNVSSDYPRLLHYYLLTQRHEELCKGLILIAINCDKVIESNANLRVECLLLFSKAVGACLT
jgi:hypothetical protein